MRHLTLAIAVLVGGVFANTVQNGFVYDDHFNIERNAFILGRESVHSLFTSRYYSAAHELSYRPVVTLSLWLDRRLFGSEPAGFHVMNVTLHAVNVALVFRLLVGLSVQPLAAGMGSLLFGLHPVQSEVVAVPSFRDDILASIFMLTALLAARRYAFQEGGAGSGISAVVAALVAGLSKETAWMLPLVWLCLIGTSQMASPLVNRRVRGILGGFFLAAGIAVIVGKFIVSPAGTAMAVPLALPFDRPTGSLFETSASLVPTVGLYVKLLLWPAGLSADHRPPHLGQLGGILPLVLGVVAVLALVAWLWRRLPLAGAGLTIFSLLLIPALNLVPIRAIFAERYLYLPLVGVACLTAGIVGTVFEYGKLVRHISIALGAIFLGVLSVRTAIRNVDWKDDRTLWNRTLQTDPGSFLAHNNLGVLDLNEVSLRQAKARFERALALNPQYFPAWNNLGRCLTELHLYDDATEVLKRAIALNPKFAEAHNNLGVVYARQREWEKARVAFRSALDADPWYDLARRNYEALDKILSRGKRRGQ